MPQDEGDAFPLPEGVRQRSVSIEAPASEVSASGDSPSELRRPVRTLSTSTLGWKSAFNAVKASARFQDKGLDVAFKDESLQRPSSNGTPHRRRPIFGDIQYPGGNISRYCVIGSTASESCFYDLVASHPEVWNLEAPRLILSIMGGAGHMQLDPAIETSFSEGLVRVAKQTSAWVITGGTASGVMAMAGKAMHAHDKKRTVPLIGITSFGSFKSRWRTKLDFLPPEDENRVVRIVDAPMLIGDEPPEDKSLAAAQEHHTHLIVCDGGERGVKAFGQEGPFRARLEEHVARMFKPDESAASTQPSGRRRNSSNFWSADRRLGELRSRDPTSSADRRMAVAGDEIRRAAATLNGDGAGDSPGNEALRVMILVNGGPVSFESVALALRHNCPVVVCRGSGRAADFLAAMKDKKDASFKDYEEVWKTHMNAGPDANTWTNKYAKDTPDGFQTLRWIVENDSCVVFVHTDRLEDVVIGAVLKNIWTRGDQERLRFALQDSLNLAVQWHCTKHCRDLCSRLVNLDGKADDTSLNWIFSRFITKEWVEADASHVVRVLYECFPTAARSFDTSQLEPKIKWKDWATFEKCRDSTAALFIWLIENGASSEVVDAMWLQQEFPAHAALAAAAAFRQAAETRRHSTASEKSGSRTLAAEGDRYEQFAITLLRFPNDPTEFLFRRSSIWGTKNLVTMAHDLECKTFVMEERYTMAINLLWFTPGPFEQYYFFEKKRNNLEGVGLLEIAGNLIMGVYSKDADDDALSAEEFWSIPKIKSLTHSVSRIFFIFSYSWFTLYGAGVSAFLLKILLFWYGLALGAIEVLQIQEKGSFRDYLKSGWNVLDIFLIGVLLLSLFLDWIFVPMNILSANDVLFLHAFNLLPCYCRLLQMLELSEYFGTLFITFFDMYRDTVNFMGLLSIVAFGFSCALTPMLWPSVEARWDQGVFWTFWAIFGDVEDEKSQSAKAESVFAFLIYPLRYSLYLTLNVLLVNLLIAQMSDTFASNKEESKRVWAYQCVDAVLEFASTEAHPIPPPFDLKRSVQTILKKWRDPDGDDDEEENGIETAMRQQTRQEKRAIHQLQQKAIKEEAKEGEESTVQEAMEEFERTIRTAASQVEKMGEIAALRDEVADLKTRNAVLDEENKQLKVWYSLLAGRASRLMDFVDQHKPDEAPPPDSASSAQS